MTMAAWLVLFFAMVAGTRGAAPPCESLTSLALPHATLAANSATHPLIQHYARTRDGRAYKMSDLLTQEQFHRTQT